MLLKMGRGRTFNVVPAPVHILSYLASAKSGALSETWRMPTIGTFSCQGAGRQPCIPKSFAVAIE